MVQKVANTNLLDGVAVFVGVINSGSFTAEAQELGHSTSYVSKEITRLEKRLGSRLLNRTTRTISLTDAGRAYFERCNQIVIDAENAERSISQLQDKPRGLLRVNAPVSFASIYLLDYLSDLSKKESTQIENEEIKHTKEFVPGFSNGDRTRSFLKIQDGCNYFCAFCGKFCIGLFSLSSND